MKDSILKSKKNLVLVVLFIFISCFYFSFVGSATPNPLITWEPPTPDSGNITTNDWVTLNTTITDESNISAFFDWNYSLVAYWNFQYTNASGVYDNSSYDNFITFGGSGPSTSNITIGKFGNAMYFDGANDYVKTTNNFVVNPSALTISSWFKKEIEVLLMNVFCIRGLVLLLEVLIIG